MSSSAKRCPLKGDCKKVKLGNCNLRRECWFGINCLKLSKRQCHFYHPKDHFTTTNCKPTVIKKLHKKAANANRRWTETDDALLIKYMNNNPNSYLEDEIINKIVTSLGRTSGAIKTRFRHINKAKENKNENKNKNKSNVNTSAEDSDSSICSSEFQWGDNINEKKSRDRKNDLYLLFNKLIIYYKMDNNNFSADNLEKKLKQFEKLNWNGNEKQMKEIMLNTPLIHFKNALIVMENKYGIIDVNKQQKIISQLKLTRNTLNNVCKDIDLIINKISNNNLLGYEKGFAELTGYDLNYFEKVLNVINGPKITKNEIELKDNVKIKVEGNENDYYKQDDIIDENVILNENKELKQELLEERRDRSRSRDRNRNRYISRSRSRSRDRYYNNRHRNNYDDRYDRRHRNYHSHRNSKHSRR